MTVETTEAEILANELQLLRETHPHLESLLKAFGPIFLEKKRWLSENTSILPNISLDPLRFTEGVPLCRQNPIFSAEDPWESASLSATKAIRLGFQKSAADMDKLSLYFSKEGTFKCFSGIFIEKQNSDHHIEELATKLNISSISLYLFLRTLSHLILSKKAQSAKAELLNHSWKKGYCPVCGSFPHLAILGDNGQRHLHCPDCGQSWLFSRLTCPYCEYENPENTNYFYIEGQKEDSAFTCDKCNRYLLTASYSAILNIPNSDIIALRLSPLDIILQDKGFVPVGECEWNIYGSSENRETVV
ncbi:MAG: formate dehydrogenase accessory protein FdhE [Desulforhopalus sp.]|nr:formate dehydrogenase accessory protein FdhE [Desulforhopalus sp.]